MKTKAAIYKNYYGQLYILTTTNHYSHTGKISPRTATPNGKLFECEVNESNVYEEAINAYNVHLATKEQEKKDGELQSILSDGYNSDYAAKIVNNDLFYLYKENKDKREEINLQKKEIENLKLEKKALKAGYKSYAGMKLSAKKAADKAAKEKKAANIATMRKHVGEYLYIERGWKKGGKGHFNKSADLPGFSAFKTTHKFCELVTKENYKSLATKLEN